MFDWHEYIELAERLHTSRDEASLRSAISRAYYGVFCIARNWLVGRGFSQSDLATPHAEIWNEFINRNHPIVWTGLSADALSIAEHVGYEGLRQRRRRNEADYNNEFVGLAWEAGACVRRARIIESLVATLDAAMPRDTT